MELMHQNAQEQALASSEQPDGVAIYVRWSTADQGDGTTLEVQLEACRKLCTGHGWTVPEELIFVDAGESGGNLSRPALDRLRTAVRKGTVRRVIVYRLDRLTRDTPDFNRLVRDEWNDAKTCQVISTVEGQIDVENPTTLLSANIFVGFAEYERLVIRARTYSGKQKRAAAGLNPGISIPPYGYWHGEQQGTFAQVESEAAIVRRVFQEYVSGKGFSSICSNLNGDGILSRFGKAWDVSVIKNMVANPAYIGVMEYGKYKYTRKSGRKTGQKHRESRDHTSPNYHYKEGVYPPIIDQATWDMAQSIRELRKKTTNPRHLNGLFLLSGIAVCHCGYPLSGRTLRQKDRAKVRREYRCSSMAHNKGFCDAGTIEADILEDLVYSLLKEQINKGVMQDVIARAREARGARVHQLQQALADIQTALTKTKKSQARLRAAFYAEEEEPDAEAVAVFKDEMAQLLNRQKALVAQERETLARLQEAEENELPTAWVEDVAAKLDVWDSLDDEQRKSVLRVAIKSFTVYRKKYVNQVKGVSRRSPNPVEFQLVTRLEDMGLSDKTIPLVGQGAS